MRVIAAGVAGPVALELVSENRTTRLTLTGDGAFAFDATLADGAAYTVTIPGQAPCAVEGGDGVIAGADGEIAVRCSLISELALSGLAPTSSITGLDLEMSERVYAPEVALLQQVAFVTALTLAVSHFELGWNATYRVRVTRGGDIAQVAYGKPSSPGGGDQFGFSVAMDGDTLAVGALVDDSGATGVGGDPADGSAVASGAVYVFRRHDGAWAQDVYLKASNTDVSDSLGNDVAVSGDALAIGAFAERSAASGVNGDQSDNSVSGRGAVYVFH